MRVLLTTKRGAGHFGPLIPFAHAFRRAGAEVLVAAPRSAAPMVSAECLDLWFFDEAPEAERDAVFAAAWRLPEEQRGPYVFAEAFVRIDARAALPGMLDVCRRWRPDVVMSEISELAGPLVAEALGIPAICVGIFQQGKGEGVAGASQVLDAVDGLRAELGLPLASSAPRTSPSFPPRSKIRTPRRRAAPGGSARPATRIAGAAPRRGRGARSRSST